MDVRKFREDLHTLTRRACKNDEEDVRSEVYDIADVLVGLYKKNFVKINHSALELVCARSLIKEGYRVKVEHRLDRTLVCDVHGTRGDGRFIVEIETGFIPPEAALEPRVYARTRIASKIARYSRFAGKFALGTTPSYVLEFPEFFLKHPRRRTAREVAEIKAMTDVQYNKPPITLEELRNARIDSVLVIDVDSASTTVFDPQAYQRGAAAFVRQTQAEGVGARAPRDPLP